jgi:hypothetical protein
VSEPSSSWWRSTGSGLRLAGEDLSFFSTVTTFGTAVDVTLAELTLEAFYPADAKTKEFLLGTSS